MTNIIRRTFRAHPFHLVSPSPWPIFTCLSLLTLTVTAVLTMHGFTNAENFLALSFLGISFISIGISFIGLRIIFWGLV